MTTDLQVYEGTATVAPPALFGTNDPEGVIARATAIARPLAQVIEDRNLYLKIRDRRHVTVQGWTLLGSMLGVFPVTAWTRPIELNGIKGWEAKVEARTLGGALVGAAEAQCMSNEANWKGKDDFTLRSMAQTRATSKALRMPLGFVMALAGYDATPAEEMPADDMPPQRERQPREPMSPAQPAPNAKVDAPTLRKIVAAAAAVEISPADIQRTVQERFGRGPRELTMAEAETVIAELEAMAAAAAAAAADVAEQAEQAEQAAMPIEAEARPVERAAH